ncbi:MAG TPA: FecR family protein [Candidatus Acidoferrales bacterium]|nr:FecR family protein [Candidatus Acidoferrales bacterium]
MKKLQTLLAIAMGGALLNLGQPVSAQPVAPGYATVIRVKGEASYSLDGGAHKFALVPGKFLEAGSTIYTGDDGVVDVILGRSVDFPQATWAPKRISLAPDSPVRGLVSYRPATEQNAVRIMNNSALVIDKLTTTSSGADTVSDTELDLKQGSIYASVKKLSPAAQYLVKTPTGIAGVRGTEFSITLNSDGSIKAVAVYRTFGDEGLVLAITSAAGTTQTYMIKDGEIWEPGNPNPVPITPQLRDILQKVFAALRTPYYQLTSFDYDRTEYRESTDFGF